MLSTILGVFSSLLSILFVSFMWTMYVSTMGLKHLNTTYDKILSWPVQFLAKFLVK